MENPIKMDDLGVPLFLETSIWWIFMASPWWSSSLSLPAWGFVEARASFRLSRNRQKTAWTARFSATPSYGRGEGLATWWWWWCGCCGFRWIWRKEVMAKQWKKLRFLQQTVQHIIFWFVYDLSTFLVYVYSVCIITNICSQQKICRMAMAQNIMSRWGFLRFSKKLPRLAVLTTKCRRMSWVRRPSRAAVATGLRCQSGCRWRAHHNALLKPSISAREAYLKDEFDEGGPTGSETWNWKKGFFFWKDSHVLHLLHSLSFFRTFFCRCCGSTCQAPVKDGWRMPTDMWRGLRSFELWRGECTSQVHSYFWIFPQISDFPTDFLIPFVTRWASTRYGTNFTTYKQPENKLGFPWIKITPSFF